VHKLTLSFKDRILKTYQPSGNRVLIGSAPHCDIQIENLAVKPEHAIIEITDDALTLKDISDGSGILVNGKPVKECELESRDNLIIGKHTITYIREFNSLYNEYNSAYTPNDELGNEAPAPAPSATGKGETDSGWLQFMNGPKLGRTLRLDRSLTRLGKMGQQSAMIASRNGGYFISHLEGDIVTRVGNREIGSNSVQLKEGDTIQIGDIKMLFFTGK
jgi:predicted component of type VI protein secretion system